MQPAVSIIIVNYNTRQEAMGCLASIAGHCPQGRDDVVVVDNDSRPGQAVGFDQALPGVRLLMNGDNLGFGGGCNRGAAAARGRYLFFLNPDTELIEDTPEALARFLDEHPQAAAVGCRLVYPDGKVQPSAARFPTVLKVLAGRDRAAGQLRRWFPRLADRLAFFPLAESMDKAKPMDWCVGSALMVRRSAFEAVGGFDERIFLYAEEMDLCRRVWQAGGQVWFTPQTTVVHGEAGSFHDAIHPRRMSFVAAGHRYYYRKHHGTLGGAMFMAAEILAAGVKSLVWLALALLKPGQRRACLEKSRWHRTYLRHYFAVRYPLSKARAS